MFIFFFFKTRLYRQLKAIYEEISKTKEKVSSTKLCTYLGSILKNMVPSVKYTHREQSVVTPGKKTTVVLAST